MPKYGLLDPGTCLPVLEAVCHVFDVENTLEFGAGIWSTFSLIRNCKSVTSIENVKEWVDKVKKDYSYKNNLNIIHWEVPMHEYLKETDKDFDLIFIDGDDRLQCLNNSINRAPIIICHDTHRKVMDWGNAIIPDYYNQLTYTGCDPYLTTIFYHNKLNLKDVLFDVDNFNHKGTYIDKNFWTDINIVEHHKNSN